MAPINALKNINSNEEINIYTDSQYVKLGITEWINTWVKNNWQTSKKEEVKNKDLWIELYNLNKSLNVGQKSSWSRLIPKSFLQQIFHKIQYLFLPEFL